LTAITRGGAGGAATGFETIGGNGGAASATAYAQAVQAGGLALAVSASGGAAGDGWRGASGGNGGSAVADATALGQGGLLSVEATGGKGGGSEGWSGGNGGDASASLAIYGVLSEPATVTATGGEGGNGTLFVDVDGDGNFYYGSGGSGGVATSHVSLEPIGPGAAGGDVNAVAVGGRAGFGFFGGIGNGGSATAYASTASGRATASAYGGDGSSSASSAGDARAEAYGTQAEAYAQGGAVRQNAGLGTAIAEGQTRASASASGSLANALAQTTNLTGSGEARSIASASTIGGPATARAESHARSSDLRYAAIASAGNSADPEVYMTRLDAESAAKVGGPSYGSWVPGSVPQAVSYASSAGASSSELGQGVHGAAYGAYDLHTYLIAGSSGVDPASHLLLTFSAPVVESLGFERLDLSISYLGSEVFSRTFTSVSDALLFFGNRTLDLGLLPLGDEPLSLSLDSYLLTPNGGFGYSFAASYGPGLPVAAVPEASSWLMLATGLALVAGMARRRRRPDYLMA
jgi:hypothetical protein